jgi:hypothetical protein
MAPRAEKIDVHAHFLPASYRDLCKANGLSRPDGFPALPVCHVLFRAQQRGCSNDVL